MLNKIFLEHPRSVDETYFQHMVFASALSAKLLFAAFAALVHAVIPILFEKTASALIADLYNRTHNRGR